MGQILNKLKLMAAKMIRAAEGIKQQIEQQGQHMDDRSIMKTFILPHFETAFRDIQNQIFEENDIDEYDIEEAVNYYIDNGNLALIEISEKIRLIYSEFGGDVDVGVGYADDSKGNEESVEDITLERVLELFHVLSVGMGEATDSFCRQFVEKSGLPQRSKELTEQFHHGLLMLSEE
jgi:hypothetical protein